MAAPSPDLEHRACPPTRVQHAPRYLRDQKDERRPLGAAGDPHSSSTRSGHLLSATSPDTTLPGLKRYGPESLRNMRGSRLQDLHSSCGRLAIHPYASVRF